VVDREPNIKCLWHKPPRNETYLDYLCRIIRTYILCCVGILFDCRK